MGILTVTAKGQVTLRKDVLHHLGAHPGSRLVVDKLPDGRVEVHAERSAGKITDVFNALKKPKGAKLSLAQIENIAASGWARAR